jgi:outer membrane lipoprotein-sorting protein
MPRLASSLRFGLAIALAAGLCACTPPAPAVSLAQPDAAEIRDIAAFLNGITRLQANFVQTGDLGTGAGKIWLDRPGHLRIDYAGPDSSVMVASAGRLMVLDRRTRATTTMAVSRTPLGILLAPSITLDGDVTVLGLRHVAGQTQITLGRTSAPAQGTLSLAFLDHPLVLTSVTLVDARGRSLTMALSGVRTDPVITPDLFASPSS